MFINRSSSLASAPNFYFEPRRYYKIAMCITIKEDYYYERLAKIKMETEKVNKDLTISKYNYLELLFLSRKLLKH